MFIIKKRILVIISLVCLIAVWGIFKCVTSRINQAGAIQAVHNYITYSSLQDWSKASFYLTGGALIAEQENSKHNKGNPVIVTREQLHVKAISSNFAIVNADVTDTPGNNRWSYRLELEKVQNKWHIFNLELASPDLPTSLNIGNIPNGINDVINSYVTASIQGRWDQAQQYLTGEALIESQQHPIKQVNIRGQVSDMQLTSMGSGDGYFLVKADYTVTYPNMKPFLVSVIITMTNDNGFWKIVQVDKA